MVLSLLPVSALAVDEKGSSADNPFTTVAEYNTAISGDTWNGKDIYLTITGGNFDSTTNLFNLTNVQSRVNPPKLHLTLTGCTFTGNTSGEKPKDQGGHPSFMYLSNCQELKIDGCTFDSGSDTLTYGINWNLIQIKDAEVSITDCTFKGEYGENAIKLNQRNGTDDTATDVSMEGEFPASIKSATISGCTFEKPDKAIILLGSAGKNNGNAAPSTGAFPVTITAAENCGANVFLAYLASNTEAEAAMGGNAEAIAKLVVSLSAGETAEKTANGDFASPDEFVAKIGDDKYTSLQSAVDAVTPGEETTITLLDNASGDGVKISSGNSIIFDLGGFTYTIDGETVGSSGTETNGFQLLKNSNITFKNGTITSEKAKILIQNYSNLTLDNVKLDGTKLNDTVPYTLSNNFGNTVIKDSAIIAKEGGYAFDLYYWPKNGYGDGVSVTVEGNSVINGNVQYGSDGTDSGKQDIAEKASLNITDGTFTGSLSTYGLGTASETGISISGGTFKTSTSSTWQGYVQPGMKLENGAVVIDTTTAVAKIGDVGYTSLSAALAAAQDGNTITMLKEYNATSEGDITFNADKAVTLDLGGYELTLSKFNLIQGQLTVKHGSVDCAGQAFNVYAGPTATDELYTKLVIEDDVTINANYGICLFPEPSSNAGYSSAIEVYGKIESGGIFVSGNLGNDATNAEAMLASGKLPTVTIYDGAVVSDNTEGQGIAINGLANVTVNGGTITGSEAIGVKRGTLTVNGGTFISNGEYVDPAEANNNGTENTGATISITGTYNYAGTISVTLKGGTFTSQNAPAVYLGHSIKDGVSVPYTNGVNLDIQGGTFTSLKEGMTPIYVANKASGDAESYTKNVVSGGKFSQDLSESEYLADTVQYQVNHVAGGFSYAETLTQAQAAAQSGDTITDLKATVGNTATLTLNYNDGGATANVTYTVEADTSVTLPTPSRVNYTFGGWSDGTNTYNGGTTYTVTETATLTAQWTYNGGSSSGGGSSTTYYSSTVEKAENGTVAVSPKNASKGSTVTVTVTPDEGYVLDTITVTDKSGNAVEVTKTSDGKYTFKMPGTAVTVKATFKEEEPAPVSLPFTDVAENAWYYDAVAYVYQSGMMTGTNDGTTFSPSMNLTRGMMAQVMFNIEKGTAPATGSFTDVAADAWYADAVNWAAAKGIVGGYGNGNFGPEDSITREQMAVLLYNYAKFKGEDMTATADLSTFSDGDQVSDWAQYAMKWAVAEGLISGSNNALNPLGTASRAEVAQILMNYFNK